MFGTPLVVTALALLLGSIEPAKQPRTPPPVRIEAVPVLMYHVLADPPPGAAWPQLYVSPAEFGRQVDWLAEQGYEAVTLTDVWRNWHAGAALPPRPVVITFDDGHGSVRRQALPILSRRGWRAVLNLKLGNLEPGSFTDERRPAPRRGRLGAGRAHLHTPRSPYPRRRGAGARGGRLARRDRATVRRPGRLLLLPRRTLRREGRRSRPPGGLPRRDDNGRGPGDAGKPLRAAPYPGQPRRRCPRTR